MREICRARKHFQISATQEGYNYYYYIYDFTRAAAAFFSLPLLSFPPPSDNFYCCFQPEEVYLSLDIPIYIYVRIIIIMMFVRPSTDTLTVKRAAKNEKKGAAQLTD